jgi:GNAT superfamily N-acetyltransferase
MSQALTITTTGGGADLDAVKALCREFLLWNRSRYAHLPWLVERYYDPANWDAYLAALTGLFEPPSGDILLARLAGEPAGCALMRRIDASTCEMKHLYVRDDARGRGVASQLCAALMMLATERGFKVMRLETGFRNDEAIGLYRRLGFRPCEPQGAYPADVLPLLRFMKAHLSRPLPNDR